MSMVHQFIFKDTETGRELVLPVTPKGYDIEHGRKANSISFTQAALAGDALKNEIKARED